MKFWYHRYRQVKLKMHKVKFLLIVIAFMVLLIFISSLSSGTDQEDDSVYNKKLNDIVYNNNVLREKLELIVKKEENVSDIYSKSILQDLQNVMMHIHQLETHLLERSIQHLKSQPILNNHIFQYIHNPYSTCAGIGTEVIIAVPSAVSNFEKRQKVRNGARADYVKDPSNKAKMLFFLARTFHRSIQAKVDSEVKEFGDIVQENFEDIYHNNRLKSVSILRWVSTYCFNTKYVIRSDDDINVNISALMPVIDRTADKLNNFIIGYRVIDDEPQRKWFNKYYMSMNEYHLHKFPPFLLGGILAFPVSTAKILYEAALRIKPIWLEDVYITGVCTAVLHIPVVTAPEFYFDRTFS